MDDPRAGPGARIVLTDFSRPWRRAGP